MLPIHHLIHWCNSSHFDWKVFLWSNQIAYYFLDLKIFGSEFDSHCSHPLEAHQWPRNKFRLIWLLNSCFWDIHCMLHRLSPTLVFHIPIYTIPSNEFWKNFLYFFYFSLKVFLTSRWACNPSDYKIKLIAPFFSFIYLMKKSKTMNWNMMK